MTADADWFRRTADLVHSQASQSRARDGLGAETVLCFDDRGELYLTILGTGPGISAETARQHRPRRTVVLDTRAADAADEVARLIREAVPRGRELLGAIYSRTEPDWAGPEVRTTAVSGPLEVSWSAVTVLPGAAAGSLSGADGAAGWLRRALGDSEGRPGPMSGM